ncbi:MAG: hypothetical protein ACRYFK_03525 [Janthinobacterium lividum]
MKPLLLIVLRGSLFKTTSFELAVSEEELRGKREGIESVFKLDYFQSIVQRSFYYKLTTKASNVVYLITDQLTQEERRILDNRLTA